MYRKKKSSTSKALREDSPRREGSSNPVGSLDAHKGSAEPDEEEAHQLVKSIDTRSNSRDVEERYRREEGEERAASKGKAKDSFMTESERRYDEIRRQRVSRIKCA